MKKLQKILKISGLVVLVALLLFVGKYYYDLSFKGDDNIQLLGNTNEISTIEDLINISEFKNNVLYIDIWGTSCGPCILEFKHTPELKKRYKGKPVKFIYLATPYKHYDDEQQWKMMIKKYNLEGYHMLISAEFYDNIWKCEGIKNKYQIPHYILIDKEGNISQINALRPGVKQKLYNQIDNLLERQVFYCFCGFTGVIYL